MSNHAIPIIEVGDIIPHPNADRLAITTVNQWQVVIGKDDFKSGDKAFYVPPDFTVPVDSEPFKFLQARANGKDRYRVRVAKLRGELSQGLLMPSTTPMPVGFDVAALYDIQRYVPELVCTNEGTIIAGPPGLLTHKFDVESLQSNGDMFKTGDVLIVTEKLHGANVRVVWHDKQLWVGSRTNWWRPDEKTLYWRAAIEQGDNLLKLCQSMPSFTFYGEAYGSVQKLRYGCKPGEVRLALFAAMAPDGKWCNTPELRVTCAQAGVAFVPYVTTILNDAEGIASAKSLAEGNTRMPGADHMMEGVVLCPAKEQVNADGSRACLKIVSNRYLMKAND